MRKQGACRFGAVGRDKVKFKPGRRLIEMLFRKSLAILAFAALVMMLSVSPMARTITVDDDGPADYSSIKEAVDAASPGDTVLVRAGTYHEWSIRMKDGMVLKGAGIDSSVIINDVTPPGDMVETVIFEDVEDAKMEGFTICGPRMLWHGGRDDPTWETRGIIIDEGSVTLLHNKIVDFETGILIADERKPERVRVTINGNIITHNYLGVVIFPGPPEAWYWFELRGVPDQWDVRWNWWGTTDQDEIRQGILILPPKGSVLYEPWLTEPVTSFQETPGIHYNNIYGNNLDAEAYPELKTINLSYGGYPFVSVESSTWGTIKHNFR